MKRVQDGPSARVTGSLAKGAACSFPTPLSEAVARHSTTPSSKSAGSRLKAGALSTAGAALVLRAVLRHGRVRMRALLVSGFVFARVALGEPFKGSFVLRHVAYSAAPTTPSSPWLRVDATLLSLQRREKPDPEPIENQRRRPQPAVPRGSPAPPAAIDKSQNDLAVVGTRQETDGSPRRAATP